MSSTSNWKTRDAELYGELPVRYSAYVERIGAHVVAEILRLAKPRLGERALDVGSGTGTATVALARAIAPGGLVVGVDHSRASCVLAMQRIPPGLSIVYRAMDAESLAFAPASFDLAISFSAIFHFPHPRRALEEIARVLRPSGRLVLSHHAHEPTAAGARERAADDWLAPDVLERFADRWLAPAHHEPVPTWSRSNGGAQLAEWLADVGLEVEAETRVHDDVRWDDPDEYLEAQMMIASDLRTRASEASAEAREGLRREFTRAASEARRAGARLLYPFGAVCIAARKTIEP